MSQPEFNRNAVVGTVILAAALWFVTFYLDWGNFWVKISISALVLAGLSARLQADFRSLFRLDGRSVAIGLVSAAALYGVFWVGQALATQLLPFAQDQIGGVYAKGEGTPLWAIALLLLFVTGPSEEIFWRGFLQRQLMQRFGGAGGWALASLVYAGVHLWTLNLMLVGAAAVAGAFWGLLYWKIPNLVPVIVSHALWSTVIFAVFPMGG